MPADLKRPVSITFDVKGYNRVANSLRRLASDYRVEIDDTVSKFVKNQRANLKGLGYPPQTNASQPFKSDRQRRYFFWALRSGIITVPYPRTGTLANSWRSRKNGWADWVIENSTAYAALVVGKGKQSKYHASNWWIAEDAIDSEIPELTQDLAKEIVGLAK